MDPGPGEVDGGVAVELRTGLQQAATAMALPEDSLRRADKESVPPPSSAQGLDWLLNKYEVLPLEQLILGLQPQQLRRLPGQRDTCERTSFPGALGGRPRWVLFPGTTHDFFPAENSGATSSAWASFRASDSTFRDMSLRASFSHLN